MLRGALTARLFSEAAWQAHPEYAQVPIDRPVFVTGLPRTGTTALHRLLAADPAHQGLEMWLAEVPQPRPPRASLARPTRSSSTSRPACERHHAEHPEFMGGALHGRRPGGGVLAAAAAVHAVDLLGVPGAPAVVLGLAARAGLDRRVPAAPAQPAADRPAGRRAPLGAEEPQSPVRARRAARASTRTRWSSRRTATPRTAIASVCSLAAQASAGWSTTFTGAVIGRDQLELWASGLERFTRRARPAGPGPVLRRALRRPGGRSGGHGGGGLRALRPAVQRRRRRCHAGSRSRPDQARSAHRYALADFGLTAADVGARFSGLAAELR